MTTTIATDKGGPCPFCTGALPAGRAVTFCPHCGMNVTVAQCPACSSEVDADWHFCVTCGRDVTTLAATRGPAATPLPQ
ncbi:MAG TPA: zinc ribbon domain-containing protein [Gemmatimonadaceae bacterium]|nr:zinc ribbon domain-containing protein [Gemmatimonadaceae bacterium]